MAAVRQWKLGKNLFTSLKEPETIGMPKADPLFGGKNQQRSYKQLRFADKPNSAWKKWQAAHHLEAAKFETGTGRNCFWNALGCAMGKFPSEVKEQTLGWLAGEDAQGVENRTKTYPSGDSRVTYYHGVLGGSLDMLTSFKGGCAAPPQSMLWAVAQAMKINKVLVKVHKAPSDSKADDRMEETEFLG